MSIFRKKEKKETTGGIPLHFRVSGIEFYEFVLVATIFVMLIAWISTILLSLLYFLSVSSVLIILVYGHEAMQKGDGFSKRMLIPLAGALFFLAMSLSSSDVVFLVSAYGCALFSPVLAFFLLKKEIEESRGMREVFEDE